MNGGVLEREEELGKDRKGRACWIGPALPVVPSRKMFYEGGWSEGVEKLSGENVRGEGKGRISGECPSDSPVM